MTSQEGPGVLIGRGWGSIEWVRSEGRLSWTRNPTRLRKQELSVKLTSGTFRPGLISSKTIFPLGRLSRGSVRLLVYSPLTLKGNTEQTVLIPGGDVQSAQGGLKYVSNVTQEVSGICASNQLLCSQCHALVSKGC